MFLNPHSHLLRFYGFLGGSKDTPIFTFGMTGGWLGCLGDVLFSYFVKHPVDFILGTRYS